MLKLKGSGVFGGTAEGRIHYLLRANLTVRQQGAESSEVEKLRFEKALQQAYEQIDALYADALKKVGKNEAEIFQIHQLMLRDEDYSDSVRNIIDREHVTAEYAVAETEKIFSRKFSSMDDSYMKARAADVHDISLRLINLLTGAVVAPAMPDSPVILMADDLAPSETIRLDKRNILAIATRKGSGNSHTAILARSMNIPSVVKVDALNESLDGCDAIVDGYTGEIFIEPDEATHKLYAAKKAEGDAKRILFETLRGQKNITLDGKEIEIFANIGGPADVEAALRNDAGGIGLFRSEFLYIGRDTFPTEEEQFEAYKKVLEAMDGKKVVVRTLDIGADKQVDYFHLEKEMNPAMGMRAIRICLTRPEILKTQLRALFRASAFGNLSIMFPMITSVDEVRRLKVIAEAVRAELEREGRPVGKEIEQGIMVETPAAALISNELAKEVDFFSIGTNDLTQYTLAIDRQNPHLDVFFNPYHKAVQKLIEFTVRSAHENGIWAGVCGELGADPAMTDFFLRIGVDELSVSASYVLPLRKKIRETNVASLRTGV
jgi:phosphoenolpyruvate-protein phosphotransferase